jgi:hypothetical protein
VVVAANASADARTMISARNIDGLIAGYGIDDATPAAPRGQGTV